MLGGWLGAWWWRMDGKRGEGSSSEEKDKGCWLNPDRSSTRRFGVRALPHPHRHTILNKLRSTTYQYFLHRALEYIGRCLIILSPLRSPPRLLPAPPSTHHRDAPPFSAELSSVHCVSR